MASEEGKGGLWAIPEFSDLPNCVEGNTLLRQGEAKGGFCEFVLRHEEVLLEYA